MSMFTRAFGARIHSINIAKEKKADVYFTYILILTRTEFRFSLVSWELNRPYHIITQYLVMYKAYTDVGGIK